MGGCLVGSQGYVFEVFVDDFFFFQIFGLCRVVFFFFLVLGFVGGFWGCYGCSFQFFVLQGFGEELVRFLVFKFFFLMVWFIVGVLQGFYSWGVGWVVILGMFFCLDFLFLKVVGLQQGFRLLCIVLVFVRFLGWVVVGG